MKTAPLARSLISLTEGGSLGPRLMREDLPERHALALAAFCKSAAAIISRGGFAFWKRIPEQAFSGIWEDRARLCNAWPSMRARVRRVSPAHLLKTAKLFLRLARFQAASR